MKDLYLKYKNLLSHFVVVQQIDHHMKLILKNETYQD